MKKILPFDDIPEIPQEIVNAIENNQMLIFLGAGISRLYGYPGWRELGNNLVDILAEKHYINYSQKEILKSEVFKPAEVVTIACSIFGKNKEIGLDYVIKELSTDKINNLNNLTSISKYLSNYNSLILTTNADTSLENSKYLKQRVILNDLTKYKPEEHNSLSIIHLHGSIDNPNTMVFTSEQYGRAYNVDSDFGKKLKELFNSNWTILFIGYGVNEFELIRYFLNDKNKNVKRLFLLEGYLNKDIVKYDLDLKYFDSLGITLVPYSRERFNYSNLIRVLKKWDKDVRTRTVALSLTKKKIIDDIFMKMPNESNAKKILNMVEKNE